MKQKQKENKAKSGGWFGFGGSADDKTKDQAKESNNTLINQSSLKQIEIDIERQLEIEEKMTS